jgi:site-specific recombinase XerD
VGNIAGRILRDAGVKHAPYDGVSGHALRHTAASDVLDGGASLPCVQEMLGHVALSSTSIYLRRATVTQMRQAMEGRSYEEAA